ncbi:MAG: methyltransferase type 11 [Brevundimonas sp.]|jgi:hypothetical protein|uniref:methyltransferase type 11 n=1 Tax=Brevundimonas sp. TaxID=1871086 RepID=UPI001859F0EA|nr:methyltransferase type 11 [Brevundimonas sp.]MBA4805154.1 methyltransferase type 11 [Brevundimonas sp.]
MSFRPLLFPAVCCAAALTAACDGDSSVRISSTRTTEDGAGKGVLKVVEALQCPQVQGSLTRKGTATAGGTVCSYVGPRGTEVSLHLVALDGDTPAEALKAFENRLSGHLPQAVAGLQAAADEAKQDAARAGADAAADGSATAEATAGKGDQASVRAPGVAVDAKGDDATVRLPGLHIETRGEQASVRIGGFHIDADDGAGAVDIEGGADGDNVSIRARNDSAEIRANAAGEATRASWILTDNRPSAEGWRLVGYEARGPVGGPLVVATVRSRDRNRGRAFEDAKDLVTLNVGE